MRQRFDNLRRAMNWSWEDINRLTGRKSAQTNISKRVPAWAHLAIETNEVYLRRLELHLIDAIAQRLGPSWTINVDHPDQTQFISQAGPDSPLILTITNDHFTLSGNHDRLPILAEQLASLYPNPIICTPTKLSAALLQPRDHQAIRANLNVEPLF